MHWLQSESVKGLVQMCTESAQQILRILSSLSEQGLLGKFSSPSVYLSVLLMLDRNILEVRSGRRFYRYDRTPHGCCD